MSLEVWVTLCDDCIESSKKKLLSVFVQIELCHMENAFKATIFNTIFNLALVTILKQRSQ
jgi:hypothetical protein